MGRARQTPWQPLKDANRILGTNFTSRTQMWKALDDAWQFAGRKRWVLNQLGEPIPEAYLDTSMVSLIDDLPTQKLFIGRLKQYGAAKSKEHLAEWKKGVPSWVPDVRKKLAAQGIPFSVELLSDKTADISGDGPAFAKGDRPEGPISQAHNFQAGELGYLYTLKPQDIMLDVWPSFHALNHRPPGAQAPEGFTGSGMFNWPPVRESASYKRWSDAGQPA